jgi:photosystem II stability/assembly factor-like uncharacterized protein
MGGEKVTFGQQRTRHSAGTPVELQWKPDGSKRDRKGRRWQLMWILAIGVTLVCLRGARSAQTPQASPEAYSNLRWRLIGPFRGGRVTAVTGIPGDHSTYYAGTPGGGLWKTTDGGQVWKPIFDSVEVASVGAVAVAASDANRVYVGTGEQTPGDGVWRSDDAGATWTNIGLRDTQFISTVLVNPNDPNTLLVAALGGRAPGEDRGVFKTTDGGRIWRKVLYKDEQSGVVDMSRDPVAPNIVFAAFESGVFGRAQIGTEHGIYKSIDGGETWEPLNGQGLPASNLGRIGIVAAAGSGGRRVYAIVNQGFFRSDDSGQTWQRTTSDPRIVSTNYFGKVFANPRNPDDVFIGQTSMYRSTDGGHTWKPFDGAPSGDDFHVIWISSENSKYMILGVDQGAIISEDGGSTWSSWYNQPTGQLYHVSTDNQFPYNVYAAQQDSGTVGLPSRSDYGEITDSERFSVDGFEAAYIAPDPANPNIVYSGGWYNTIVRYDRTTGQFATVFVRGDKYRTAGMAPIMYAPQDARTLYLGTQYLLKSTDGGMSWQQASPDLTEGSASAGGQNASQSGAANRARNAAINTLSFSAASGGGIWAGTTNGRIQITRNAGKSWQDVTPKDLPAVTSISILDASHFDASTAYAVINAFQSSEPLIYRTHDGGKSWQKIVMGLPTSGPTAGIARFVREDSVRKGLLYAGTETSVWVSLDDGDHWQSLQLNLPASSMRDLAVHGDDLVLATYGRSIYILDNVTPLRQINSNTIGAAAYFYKPADAIRARWDNNQDTPLPIDVPAGKNPPDGAILDYNLQAASNDATIEITDARGNLVRHFGTTEPPAPAFPNVPDYWFAPPAVVSKSAGAHRFVWDLRYADPLVLPYNYYGALIDYTEYTLADHAIPGETPRRQPVGPLVVPGSYTVTLTVDGHAYKQQVTVRLDPRVHTSQADLEAQLAWAQKLTRAVNATHDVFLQAHALQGAIAQDQMEAPQGQPASGLADTFKSLMDQVAAIAEGTRVAPGVGPENRDLSRIYTMVESGDIRPSDAAKESAQASCGQMEKSLAAWRLLNTQTLPGINSQLATQNMAALPIMTTFPADSPCGK